MIAHPDIKKEVNCIVTSKITRDDTTLHNHNRRDAPNVGLSNLLSSVADIL